MQSIVASQWNGAGIVLRLCVAFIGLAADHLDPYLAQQRKKALGIA